ncbi:hypothetical protein [Actinomadura parmotrematis]|uniref:SMI1/KNR4 family protein n=1 Tax=Actinomadura parmotrematis TaxID=2864039 RepID=A0ABS7FQB3_9ACTN|nr:hypothetical protein [Actinomadura parmotrematis]MBW8482556.1 hypothetical protein [Actinomadura parmotrematis]
MSRSAGSAGPVRGAPIRTAETSPQAAPGDWDEALSDAFALLLGGRPAGDPAARYGVYYASESFDEFLFPCRWATPEALAAREPRLLPEAEEEEFPFSPYPWRFDVGASLFCFDPDLLAGTGPWGEGGHKGPRPFDDAFVADLRAASC